MNLPRTEYTAPCPAQADLLLPANNFIWQGCAICTKAGLLKQTAKKVPIKKLV